MRFTEADYHRAADAWGANCGPGALAAILGLTLDELRPNLGEFERKRYTNPTLMYESLARCGAKWRRNLLQSWPAYGLARVQWDGPWMRPGVPIGARYRKTHWVAAETTDEGVSIFDINAPVWRVLSPHPDKTKRVLLSSPIRKYVHEAVRKVAKADVQIMVVDAAAEQRRTDS